MPYRLGNETVFEPVFYAFWTSVSSLMRKKVKLDVQWVGGVIGMCFFDHHAFSQLRDKLCGEAYDLGSSFGDAEYIFLETDVTGKKEILQYVNTDPITPRYNNSRSLGST